MWRIMGVSLELGLLIGGLAYVGHLGDQHWGVGPWLTLTGVLVGMIGGCYNLIREVNRMEANRKKKRDEEKAGRS